MTDIASQPQTKTMVHQLVDNKKHQSGNWFLTINLVDQLDCLIFKISNSIFPAHSICK